MRKSNWRDGDSAERQVEKLARITDLLVYDRSSITDDLLEERFRIATLPQTLANPPLRTLMAHPKDHLWNQGLDQISSPALIIEAIRSPDCAARSAEGDRRAAVPPAGTPSSTSA